MSNTPSVSVVTRSFNRPELLKEVAKKLKSQTIQDFEWIVVDDCSSQEILKQDLNACKPDFGIRVFRNEKNLGLAKSAQIGISEALGKYILIHDDDDYLLPMALEQLQGAIVGNFIGATGGVRRIFQSGRQETYMPTVPPLISDIGHRNKITTIATMFLKSAYHETEGIDVELQALEDWDLWLKLLLLGDFEAVPNIIAIQRVGSTDQTLRSTHVRQMAIMRNKYLRDDIKRNAIGLGYVTNIPAPETIGRLDYLLAFLSRLKKQFLRR